MVRLAADAHYRHSKRGLVLAGSTGQTVLFEHPRAALLPDLLVDDPSPDALADRLGPPLDENAIADLVALDILTFPGDGVEALIEANGKPKVVTFTRAGIMIAGIGGPARWLDRNLVPLLLNPFGGIAVLVLVAAGIVALVSGRPDLPMVSSAPAVEAMLMVTLGMAATICHEIAHAVALAHFGPTPRRAGFGFYWGALSFYVDSTPALTLPRNQRVIQALVGLAVDVIAVAGFAVAAHLLIAHPLPAIVCWRLAILGCVDIVINLAPILQVDGHWALADLLDEPDLAPRGRHALGDLLRRRLPREQRWLAVYGAFSLFAGLGLISVLGLVFWANTSQLVMALFTGSFVDVFIGLYYVGPLTLGILFSVVGLIAETAFTATASAQSV